CIPSPGRGGIGGCSLSFEHTRSVQWQTGTPGQKRVLVGKIVHLLVQRLADAMARVAVDAEEHHGLGILALRLQQGRHFSRVHRIDAAIPFRGREEHRRISHYRARTLWYGEYLRSHSACSGFSAEPYSAIQNRAIRKFW